jgi:putative FmdB family regulatory protein
MPLYDYGCPSCGFEQEVQHSMSEIGKIQISCDRCGKLMAKKLSAPTLIGFDNVGRSISKKDEKGTASGESSKSTTAEKKSSDAA